MVPELVDRLGADRAVVLQAPPGAGKTTRIPLALVDAPWLEGQKVVVLQPRRLAAIAAARRMASEVGQEVGRLVGYRVRMDTKVSAATRVEVVTDGLFLRQLMQDPDLAGVGCVIFDEFHERGVNSDLALAFLLEVQELRPELAVLVMSATLASDSVAELLGGAPLLRSEGRAFPVEVTYLPSVGERLEDHVARAVRAALAGADGDVLVFLPGLGEIRRAELSLQEAPLPENVLIAPLYGDLPLERQQAAIRRAPEGHRKVVLATSIAECSVTIEGVTAVVDAGLARRNRFDTRRGMDALVTEDASQASAEQRRGRAGRVRPGACIRLWRESEQQVRPEFDPPELARCDLAPFALSLAAWGTQDVEDLRLLDPVDPGALEQGRELLRRLGALDARNAATPHGQALLALGVHPRLAHMLLWARDRQLGALGARVAVLLSERDPLERKTVGSDIELRLKWMQARGPADRLRERFHELARDLGRRAGFAVHRDPLGEEELSVVGELVAQAYPDRVALAYPDLSGLLMSMGRPARLPGTDPLAVCKMLAIAEVDGRGPQAQILTAARLGQDRFRELFADQLEWRQSLSWDKKQKRVQGSEELRFGSLALETRPCSDFDPLEVRDVLVKALQDDELRPLPWTKRSRALQSRLTVLHRHRPQQWPDRSEAWLRENLAEWLGDQLIGVDSFSKLKSVQLEEGLWQGFSWQDRLDLDRLLPSSWRLPSGRAAAIDYSGEVPVLAAKLQEFFGCADNPAVLEGSLPLQVHLLSPAGRPLQVTSDLAGFWDGSYAEVRRATRGRYPKHPWPEDPRAALPTAKSKKQLAREQGAER